MMSSLVYIGQTTLAVALLIGLVLLVRRPFAKYFGAKAAYALWVLPAIRLVLPPLPAGWSLFSPIGQPAASAAPNAAPLPLPVSDAPVFVTQPSPGASELTLSAAQPLAPALPVSPAGAGDGFVEMLVAAAGPSLLVAWLVGTLGYLGWACYRQMVFAHIIKAEGQPASLAVQTEVMEICQAIGLNSQKVSVQTSFISDGPLVSGLTKPVVLLPAWFEEDYTLAERRVALSHELTHVKRGDLWALQAATVFLALQWFNPLAHFAMRAFRSDQEASCDADVLRVGTSSPHDYGATLIKAVRKSRATPEPMLAASLTLNHSLAERLIQMRNPLPSFRQRFVGTALTAGVGSAILLASACSMTASAHPHELEGGPEDEVSETRVRTHRIFIDGEETGREIVILDNPMERVELDIAALDDLSVIIEAEARKIEEIVDRDVVALSGDIVTAMAEITGPISFETEDGETRVVIPEGEFSLPAEVLSFVGEVTRLSAEGEVNEEEIEALAEVFEERMEAWGEGFEARMEAMEPIWEARAEAHAERWSDAIEARIEKHAERIELHSEVIEAHSERIERASEVIESLVEDCEDQTGLRVVTKYDGITEETYKAVCLDGGGSMTNQEVIERLEASGDLSAEELSRLEQRLEEHGSHSFEWSFSHED